jgi:response regulator of citrate/malate metabolism
MKIHKDKITILVVDDEFIFRELNKMRINDFLKERVDYKIFTATGFEDAIEILKNRPTDLVFTDMFMDGKENSGIGLADRIKEISDSTKVFLVSNAGLRHIKKNAIGTNVLGCFQQPLRKIDMEFAFRTFI